jgi:hypothetical protein
MKVLFAVVLVAACSDASIDMHLQPAQTTGTIDLSCVTAVDILPLPVNDAATLDIGNREYDTQTRVPCAIVKNAMSIADVEAQIAGQIDIPIPPGGLAALELRGREGTCDEIPAYRDAIFYGAAVVDPGSDELNIPVRYNVSCGQTKAYTIQPIDLPTLVKTKTCPPPMAGQVFEGTVRPSLLEHVAPPLIFEDGFDLENLDGTGQTQLTTYGSSFAGSCPSAAFQNSDFTAVVSTCINPGAPTACASPGAVEVPVVNYAYASKVFGSTSGASGMAVIGAVWSKGPVMGATVIPDDGELTQVVYGDVGSQTFMPMTNLTATNASGMFVVYSNAVSGITVNAPGHAAQHIYVGAGPYMPGTALVVLP